MLTALTLCCHKMDGDKMDRNLRRLSRIILIGALFTMTNCGCRRQRPALPPPNLSDADVEKIYRLLDLPSDIDCKSLQVLVTCDDDFANVFVRMDMVKDDLHRFRSLTWAQESHAMPSEIPQYRTSTPCDYAISWWPPPQFGASGIRCYARSVNKIELIAVEQEDPESATVYFIATGDSVGNMRAVLNVLRKGAPVSLRESLPFPSQVKARQAKYDVVASELALDPNVLPNDVKK